MKAVKRKYFNINILMKERTHARTPLRGALALGLVRHLWRSTTAPIQWVYMRICAERGTADRSYVYRAQER